MTPTDEQLRNWFLAHVLVTWRDQHGPRLRKAYNSDDDAKVKVAIAEFQKVLAGWQSACGSLIGDDESTEQVR